MQPCLSKFAIRHKNIIIKDKGSFLEICNHNMYKKLEQCVLHRVCSGEEQKIIIFVYVNDYAYMKALINHLNAQGTE